jgi:hypothetical protein
LAHSLLDQCRAGRVAHGHFNAGPLASSAVAGSVGYRLIWCPSLPYVVSLQCLLPMCRVPGRRQFLGVLRAEDHSAALIGAAASAGEMFRHSASIRSCAPWSGATSAGSTSPRGTRGTELPREWSHRFRTPSYGPCSQNVHLMRALPAPALVVHSISDQNASYRAGIVARVHCPAPIIVVAIPSFIVELAYVRLPF